MNVLTVILGILGIIAGVAGLIVAYEGVFNLKRWQAISLIVVGLFLVQFPKLFFHATSGYQYELVFPSGERSAVTSAGWKWRGYADVSEWDKYIDIRVNRIELDPTLTDKEIYDLKKSFEEVEGLMKPIGIMFVDKVTANVAISTRFKLPVNDSIFLAMTMEFKTLDNLVTNTLVPTIEELVGNTGYMFSAEDYVSGSSTDFKYAIEDQLKKGSYSVEKTQYKDTILEPVVNKGVPKIKEIQTRYAVIKRRNSKGEFIRNAHDITRNGISVSQVIVDDVILEEKFKERLKDQRDESAKRQLEQQKVLTARDAQQRLVAEGERDKAQERAIKEKEAVSILIQKETQLKEEETNLRLAEKRKQTAIVMAETEKIAADAKAYSITKTVKAGIDPKEELKLRLEAEVRKEEWKSKRPVPSYLVVNGDSKGSNNGLSTLMEMQLAQGLKTKK